ncbi:MAG: iron-containing alcohol dehydrogenase, partial [Desulfobacterales bacterium]|nr:iron-containing alcohol dehydrogenase [Desulfobacterales bacterium]
MENIKMFQTTPRMIIGPGSLDRVVDEINRFNSKKIMIVTDIGLVEAGITGKLEDKLNTSGIKFSIFDKVESDPRIEIANQAAKEIKAQGADLIIGIGGGSPIDIAKVSAILASNDIDINSYFGIDLIPGPGLKTIIIPTTSGTGSEVTPIVILSDEREKLKKGIVSPYLFPDVAILDPELTTGLPPQITAATGMDAFIHAVESYTSNGANSMTDIFAIQAIKLISTNIRTAFASGNDIKARSNMLEGSLLAGMAFANAGVTAVHAFAYPIGAEFHIPHGIANSIMLVPVMEFNMLGNQSKFAEVAQIIGEDTTGLSQDDSAAAAINAMDSLMKDLKLPRRLSEFGITESDIPMLAKGVMKVTRLLANNPRTLTVEDADDIYRTV